MNKVYSSTQQSLFSNYEKAASNKGMAKFAMILAVLFILKVFINP